jgi:dTMP kinase
MNGLFVTFEGGEGSGKSTQIQRLAVHLRSRGEIVLETREPGGTPLAERVRALLLDPGHDPGPWAEAFLMEAARADVIARLIAPELALGHVVLCDRFADSTLAYQGGGRGLDLELLTAMNRAATGGREPDLTLLFDLEPAVGLARRARAAPMTNRIDREPEAFHVRVRERFLALARANPERWVVLDAGLDHDRLERAVLDAVHPRLAASGR